MQNETTYTCIYRPCSAMADVKNKHELNGLQAAVIFMSSVFIALALFYICAKWLIAIKSAKDQHHHHTVVMRNATVERFVLEMAEEKPIRFTAEQLAGYTRNYSVRLGAGGFGTVYRGALPNGLSVAVKVLHPGLDTRSSEEQFMAEMGTIGRTHHINLVRLYGFCFDANATATRALVYEFMDHGSLDDYLSSSRRDAFSAWTTVAAIATGVARGLRYLHEECQHKIVHYDIKPGNILLDAALTPKLADFGLARLVNRADTHVSLSHGGGTPGFAAPEVWLELRMTDKCDVYSFGMLLLKILEHASNHDAEADAAPESSLSRQWFPMAAWTRYEAGELMDLIVVHHDDDPRCRELAERMCKVAFWCAQHRPSARPTMSAVVKMLEGGTEIAPPPNPFQYLMESPAANLRMAMASSSGGVNTSNHIISFLRPRLCGTARWWRWCSAGLLPPCVERPTVPGSAPCRSSVVISELDEDDGDASADGAASDGSVGSALQRRSPRLALLEPDAFVSMVEKAVKRKALKEALLGCSPRLQGRAIRDKVMEAVVHPLGKKKKAVAELRAAASIPTASVPRGADV